MRYSISTAQVVLKANNTLWYNSLQNRLTIEVTMLAPVNMFTFIFWFSLINYFRLRTRCHVFSTSCAGPEIEGFSQNALKIKCHGMANLFLVPLNHDHSDHARFLITVILTTTVIGTKMHCRFMRFTKFWIFLKAWWTRSDRRRYRSNSRDFKYLLEILGWMHSTMNQIVI